MSDHLSYQANPQTRNTAPVQFFEAENVAPLPDTKATLRPADRPRELPAAGLSSGSLQLFECAKPFGNQSAPATPPPGEQGKACE